MAPRRPVLGRAWEPHARADRGCADPPAGHSPRCRCRDGRAARLGPRDRAVDHRVPLPRPPSAAIRGCHRCRPVQQRGRRHRGRDRPRALHRAAGSGVAAIAAGYEIDLHTHSLCSDGALSPADLVKRAAARGVKIQALSDHDTLAGVAEAAATGSSLGVRIIPATELNTESEWGDAHVLGYFIDPRDAALEARFRWLRDNRGRRIELMVEKLNALGYAVDLARVLEIAQGGALGRPHLAQALFEKGYVPSYDQAFDTLLAKDSPAYVPRVGLTPIEAVTLVREHGGVPSLAHPGTVEGLERLLPQLVRAGLVGIECYYPSHTPAFTVECLRLSVRHGLVPTGGSDFHGRGEHGVDLGGVFVPPESVASLETHQARR
ncbi:MAG: PHP domain-containing protein [Chloroflexi bacterium]|nr:MAG: PHP domain-containing protein [Chloroflexota bacterium]